MSVRGLFSRKGLRASRKSRRKVAAERSAASPPPKAAAAAPPAALVERRQRLARDLAELQWDLGGLVYEMSRRDQFRLDVLNRRAAKLQELDAELTGVERLIRLDQAGAEGACPSCGGFYARGALFCWQCGKALPERAAPAAGATPAAAPNNAPTPEDKVPEGVPSEPRAAAPPPSPRLSEQPTRQL